MYTLTKLILANIDMHSFVLVPPALRPRLLLSRSYHAISLKPNGQTSLPFNHDNCTWIYGSFCAYLITYSKEALSLYVKLI